MSTAVNDFDPAVISSLAEYAGQMPDFVEKLKLIFTNMMKHLSAYPGSLPFFEVPANAEVTQDVLKQVVWRFSEGSLYGLTDLVKHLRSVLPQPYNDALPLSDQAVKDMVLCVCERKAYGFDVPKSLTERQEAPPHPALLVWEVDLKLAAPEAFPVEWRMALERGRKDRREVFRKMQALEKLVRAVQAAAQCQTPQDQRIALDRIVKLREAWRVEEKKEERERLMEEERRRRIVEQEAKAEAVRSLKADKENKKLEEQTNKERRKQEEQAMKAIDPVVKSNAAMSTGAGLSSSPKPASKPLTSAKAPEKPKTTLFNFFQKQTKPQTPPPAGTASESRPSSPAPMEVEEPEIEADLKSRWRAKQRGSRGRRSLFKVIDGVRLSAPIPDIHMVKLPGLIAPNEDGMAVEESRSSRFRLVYINMHDRTRPPFKAVVADGPWTKNRRLRLRGCTEVSDLFDYEIDTDEEWDEINNAEDIEAEEDGEEEEEEDDEEDRDSFVVSDGHFSDGDDLSEDEQEMIKRQQPANSARAGVEPVLIDRTVFIDPSTANKWTSAFANGLFDLQVYSPESFFSVAQPVAAPAPSTRVQKSDIWTSDFRRTLALFVHGKPVALDDIIRDFETEHPSAKESGLRRVFKEMFKFEKRANARRSAWFLLDDKAAELQLDASSLNDLVLERANSSISKPKLKKEEYPSVALYARV